MLMNLSTAAKIRKKLEWRRKYQFFFRLLPLISLFSVFDDVQKLWLRYCYYCLHFLILTTSV